MTKECSISLSIVAKPKRLPYMATSSALITEFTWFVKSGETDVKLFAASKYLPSAKCASPCNARSLWWKRVSSRSPMTVCSARVMESRAEDHSLKSTLNSTNNKQTWVCCRPLAQYSLEKSTNIKRWDDCDHHEQFRSINDVTYWKICIYTQKGRTCSSTLCAMPLSVPPSFYEILP